MTKLNILHLFPDALNLYGDGGNIIALQKRCEWRNIETEVTPLYIFDATTGKENAENDEYKNIDLGDFDIIFIGGGSDREQKIVTGSNCLTYLKEPLKKYIENNGVMLAICGGYQLLGHYYNVTNKDGTPEKIAGLSIIDAYTVSGKDRLISDVVVKSDLFSKPLVGFENHIGKTYINDHEPLGIVRYGNGNNGEDKKEGVRYKNLFGTYLHGSLLPKNPQLTDYLIEQALHNRGLDIKLAELNDEAENKANDYIVKNKAGL